MSTTTASTSGSPTDHPAAAAVTGRGMTMSDIVARFSRTDPHGVAFRTATRPAPGWTSTTG
jgi:hypothetical protein